MVAEQQDKRFEKGEQMRSRIINAAIVMIADSGIRSVSAAKLAQATGVSKSNIFHHFKSVDDVVMAALTILIDHLLEAMKVEYRNVDHFLDSIGQAVLLEQDDLHQLFKAFLSFYHEGLFDPRYQQALARSMDEMSQLIRNQLARLAPHPLTQEQLESASILLLSILDGIGLHCLVSGNKASYERAWQLQSQLFRQFLNGK